MGRPTLTAQKVGKHDRRIGEIEQMRHDLPINMYIEVMHIAATTGKLRTYDSDCVLTGVRDISPDQQLKAAQYLIDKAMPSKAPVRMEAAPELSYDQATASPEQLTIDQLKHLAYDDYQ